MTEVAYVSRIGSALKAQRISIAELRRRLAKRQVHVSRGALHRIVSDQPIEMVSLPLVMPVLDELNLSFEEAFQAVPETDVVARREARERANAILASLPKPVRPHSFSPEVEGELDDVATQARALLRESRPDLFDSRGRLRRRAATREMEERLLGRPAISEAEYIALTSPPGDKSGSSESPPPNAR